MVQKSGRSPFSLGIACAQAYPPLWYSSSFRVRMNDAGIYFQL